MTRRNIVCILLAVFLPMGCSKGPDGKDPEPVPVTVGTVVRKDLPVQIYAVGTVEPFRSVAVTAQVGGTLRSVHFQEGQNVIEGQLLFTIDAAPFEARVRQAEASLVRSRAEAENARAQLRRYEQLVRKEFVTREQFDEAQADARAFEATVRGAEAALENAKLELSYTKIAATVSGKTGHLNIKAGNLVRANDSATPLVTINQLRPVMVRFSVPEESLAKILEERRGGDLQVRVRTKGDAPVEAAGTLSFIDNSVDRTTGTILLKAEFANPDELLWPGQFVDAFLVLRRLPDALVAHSKAIQSGQHGPYVWVVNPDMAVEIRPVVAGFTLDEETLIQSGLKEGETVVIDGQLRLAPKVKVEIR